MQYGSVWESVKREYPAQTGEIERDIVVIGGGIAGFLTAYKLSEAGQTVTLIEADKLFGGTTGKTTAKITYNQGHVYAELYARYGKKAAALYLKSQKEAIKEYKKLIEKYGIDCDFEEVDGYIFTRGKDGRIVNTTQIMRDIGASCEVAQCFPQLTASAAIRAGGQYVFNPLKFLNALPINFEIFEHTRAVEFDVKNKVILTQNGKIKAKTIIIATHFPIINTYGAYIFKLRQSLSYTIAFKKRHVADAYLDDRDDGISLRPYDGGTLLGGGDHRTGRIERQGHFEKLKDEAEKLFGEVEVTNAWAAEDVMTFDKMPMAGRYSKMLDGVYVISGFNKWGMTNAMVCSSVIRDAILGKNNAYARLFSPQRHMKGVFLDFVSNAFTNIKEIFLGYFRITFKKASSIPVGSGKVVKIHGKKRAVYRGKDGKLYIIGSMCPHLHGELQWNTDTQTWDCPCHGSRFDIYGNIISEPATKSSKFEETEIK